MADHTIVATVTPDPQASTGFDWLYSDNGGTPSANSTIQVPAATSETFILSLVAGGQPGDQCHFPDPLGIPFVVTNRDNQVIDSPEWLKDLQSIDSSTISFTDDNTDVDTRDYFIKIKAVYNGTPTTSPDPTIVNEGTNIPDDGLSPSRSQSQPRPASAQG